MTSQDFYRLPLSACVGTMLPRSTVEMDLESALRTLPRRKRMKTEHARKYLFTRFAKSLLRSPEFAQYSEHFQSAVRRLCASGKRQEAIRAFPGCRIDRIKSWSFELQRELFTSESLRLEFLRWYRTTAPVDSYCGPHSAALSAIAQKICAHAARLELRGAVATLASKQ